MGISFDTVEDNLAFATNNGFEFQLLSDQDRSVGAAYGTLRPADDSNPEYPQRVTFLIDPSGVIRRVYEVTDREAHASEALHDLREMMFAR
jgi:peroxiredoxin Q/BCP